MKVLLAIALFCSFASAQIRFDIGTPGSAGVTTTTTTSGYPQIFAVPGVSLAFCSYPANAVPCTNTVLTYTDLTLATACPSNAQIVLQGSTTCQSTGDNRGNLGVNIASGGTYAYTLTANGVNYGPFVVTLGGSGGGGTSWNPPDPANFPGSANIPGPVNIGNFQAIEFIPDQFCGFYGQGTGANQQDQLCNLLGLPVWNANGTNQAFLLVAYSDYENSQIPPSGTVYASNAMNGDVEQVTGVAITSNQVQAQRFMVAGTAPACTFTSGGGTLPSCALDTGSTDSAGIIVATTGTGSPAGTGTITLTFSSALGTNKPVCEYQASDNVGGAWSGLAVMKDKTPATTSDLFTWTNGTTPTALSTSTAYRINYQCTAK